jgi:plastocyanin
MPRFILLFLFLLAAIGTLVLVIPSYSSVLQKVITKFYSKHNFKVTYTNEGYRPSLLEIPLGSTVTFVNSSDIPMWTASDPHPVHGDYSEFDASYDYLKGEVYTFQFTKAGTFSFHNHEKSLHHGIIRVIDPDRPMPNIDKTLAHQLEIRAKLLNVLVQNDTSTIYKVIDAIEADNALSNDCHDLAHDIGHKTYEMFGFSGAMTFNDPDRLGHTSVDDICAGGYMHGILEEVFLHQPELKDNPHPICSAIPENNRDSCFHGVGHGLMFVNKRDIPTSLSTCRSLNDFEDEHRCYEGVWMEMFWGETNHAGSDSLGFDLKEPLARCVQAAETEKPTCFLYAHLGYLRTHHHDFNGALDLCTENNLNEPDAQFCIKGIGITMMKSITSQHLERSEQLVQKLNYGEKFAYYEGVIGYARLSNVNEGILINFCNALKNDAEVCRAVLKTDP